MQDNRVPNVGPRIRALRERQGLSLRALVERCTLSVNAISLIERGENSPTVSSLHALATALGVKITDFFEDPHELTVVFVRRDQRLTTEGSGMRMQSLGIGLQNQQLEPFEVTVEPGAGSTGEPITHPGEEFVLCLEGSIRYWVGGQAYDMEAGDSLLFEASQPYSFENTGEGTARLLMVFHAAEGGHLARHRHLEG